MSWWPRLFGLEARPERRGFARRRHTVRVERLEDRTVPSADWLAWGPDPGPAVPAAPTRVTGDFNGDRRADVATLAGDGTWVVGVSDGSAFTSRTWVGGWHTPAVWATYLAGDFNGDGRDDVAALSRAGWWYVGISTGTGFRTEVWGVWTPASNFVDFRVGDFDGDSRDDVAVLARYGTWWVGRSTGSSFSTARWAILTPEGWNSFRVGDFNGDGKTDLAAFQPTGEWWLFRSTGCTLSPVRWAYPPRADLRWTTFVAGDFNGDGRDDLAGLTAAGQWWVYRSLGASFSPVVWATDWSTSWAALHVADFTGDGRDDVAAFETDGGWWLARSRGGFFTTMRGAELAPAAPARVSVADFNGDGAADPLVTDAYGQLRVMSGGLGGSRHVHRAEPGDPLLSPEAVEAVRDDLSNLPRVFADYRPALAQRLGPDFAGLTDQGLALVFSTALAYQLAYYRGAFDPDGNYPGAYEYPRLASLLGSRKLLCDEYGTLAFLLFRKIYPETPDDGINVWLEGFYGPFGNHAQLVAQGVGVPLLLDPTAGMVARADLSSLLAGAAVPGTSVRQVSLRVETSAYMEAELARFRGRIRGALFQGRYDECRRLYSIDMDEFAKANRFL